MYVDDNTLAERKMCRNIQFDQITGKFYTILLCHFRILHIFKASYSS